MDFSKGQRNCLMIEADSVSNEIVCKLTGHVSLIHDNLVELACLGFLEG